METAVAAGSSELTQLVSLLPFKAELEQIAATLSTRDVDQATTLTDKLELVFTQANA
ncbi:hypothetical protein [Ferrimonas lipolytica]|uniref:Uncharacterized protein n=1 Tax=Ferrimonas lipolytica TaxID=2724191 RepID=A0A6H1UAZ8_9GAMM|nr:hypothetical protein [Ferrimonas lipolytica]QIZ75809.1 hypothetical protein HER31_02180 [Ferrimonas lipolytica]